MRLLERKIGKRVLASFLAFVMCVGLFSSVALMDAKATDILNTEDIVTCVANGDFESGREGEKIPNWSKVAMLQGSDRRRDDDILL